jgi:hypothetical protein
MSIAIPASNNNPGRPNGKNLSTGRETRLSTMEHHGKPAQPNPRCKL